MSYEQLKRLRIEEPEDMKLFWEVINNEDNFLIIGGPETLSKTWLDVLYADDEEISIKIWILTLQKFNLFFRSDKDLNQLLKFNAYIESLKVMFSMCKTKTLPFMHNTRKWQNLIFSSINETLKINLYGMHQYLVKELKGSIEFINNFQEFLNKENMKVKIGVASFTTFIENLLKNK